jgi:hypothetical protein
MVVVVAGTVTGGGVVVGGTVVVVVVEPVVEVDVEADVEVDDREVVEDAVDWALHPAATTPTRAMTKAADPVTLGFMGIPQIMPPTAGASTALDPENERPSPRSQAVPGDRGEREQG